ncbi:MAG: ABC transporter permease [Armatimonadota bacterium]|nr:ABC transporter permease [Armatimonadota bacterium]MDR7402165.1 ABC transporter permease [Armatimonadota bacterium]MDR7404666.1 ABC transporter permease [Armatimonadota bacterium]MDR7436922.1 ABC transporter permease [Armatimonadota bacterium]MDR7472304.1 ABC transporter permease [Armatimonadota bacterium]
MRAVGVLMRWDARAVVRDRWFASVAVAFGALAAAAALMALAGVGIQGVSSFDRAAATLISLAMLFVPLLGLTVGCGWIPGLRESGALEMVLSQPVGRGDVFAGAYLGVAWGLVAATLVGFGGAGVILALRAGPGGVGAYLWLVGLSALLALTTLSVGFALSARAPTRSRALGQSLVAWLALVILSDLGVLTTVVILRLPPAVVFALAAANPVSAFRIAAIVAVTGSADLTGPLGQYAAGEVGTAGVVVLLVAVLAAWAIGGYAVGRRRFGGMVEP